MIFLFSLYIRKNKVVDKSFYYVVGSAKIYCQGMAHAIPKENKTKI